MPITPSNTASPALVPDDSCVTGLTLEDCVPWLEIALELIDRGPTGLTIEAVERYRANLLEILEHIRPAVEREAERTRTH